MTEANGSGEGDSPAVEKFRPRGVDAGMNWRGIGVLAVVGVPARAFAPACVVPVELPLELSPAAAPVIPTAWLLNPVCTPAFVPICAPTFVFAPVFVPIRAFVPVCGAIGEIPLKPLCAVGALVGAPGGLLPLVPNRGVCARLNVTVATHITITPSLIELIWVI